MITVQKGIKVTTETKHDTKRSETQLFGEVRIAYPVHQGEKKTKTPGGIVLKTPRYDATLLVPKLGPAETCPNYKRLSDMAMEAAVKAWGGWPDSGKWPIDDGDIPYKQKPKPGEKVLTPEEIAKKNEWRVGSWVIEVTNYTDQGPKVSVLTNGTMQDIPAQDVNGQRLYKSGDWGYVSMNSYTFQRETWGVNFSYEGVAYTRQGDLIGGGPKSTAQMFAGIPTTSGPGMGAPAPAPSAAPRPPGGPGVAMPPAAAPAPGLPPLPPVAAPPLAPAAPSAPPLPTGGAPTGAAPMPPIPGR